MVSFVIVCIILCGMSLVGCVLYIISTTKISKIDTSVTDFNEFNKYGVRKSDSKDLTFDKIYKGMLKKFFKIFKVIIIVLAIIVGVVALFGAIKSCIGSFSETGDEIKDYKSNIAYIEEEIPMYENEIEGWNKQIDDYNSQISELEKRKKAPTNDDLQEIANDKKISELNKQISSKQKTIDNCNKQINDIPDAIDSLEGYISDCKENISTYEGCISQYENLISMYEGCISDYEEKSRSNEMLADIYKPYISNYKKEIDGYQEKIDDYKKRISNNEKEINGYNTLLKPYKDGSAKKELQEKIDESQKALDSLNQQLKNIENGKEKAKITDYDKETFEYKLDKEIESLNEKISKLNDKISSNEELIELKKSLITESGSNEKYNYNLITFEFNYADALKYTKKHRLQYFGGNFDHFVLYNCGLCWWNLNSAESISLVIYCAIALVSTIIILLLFPIYMYPTKVARKTDHDQTTAITWLNFFFAETLIMWIILLIWANSGKKQVPQVVVKEDSLTDKLQEIQKLKEQGLLTEEEFETKKKQILNM